MYSTVCAALISTLVVVVYKYLILHSYIYLAKGSCIDDSIGIYFIVIE